MALCDYERGATQSAWTQGTAACLGILAPSLPGLAASRAPLLRPGRGGSLAVLPPPDRPAALPKAADEDCPA
jgi:hypothetical protein